MMRRDRLVTQVKWRDMLVSLESWRDQLVTQDTWQFLVRVLQLLHHLTKKGPCYRRKISAKSFSDCISTTHNCRRRRKKTTL